ncbi:hypothetical protein RAK27_11310 [Carnobacterium maltaromaticum]|uniref:Uncharacterized protein n=1 Tax=Carnobacterium maltaromaticum TaxID=2751 RepID=A0AAW9JVE7_CARML|nr:hypothetical protein [Carnobacterium maltaromaticum]MDZ5759249.1 hypothetical protein [Carnobacterium maltaromaticum]
MKEGDYLTYMEHQYSLGVVVALAQIPYKVKKDTLKNCFFIVNQNNQLIYLDKLSKKYKIRAI